MNGHGASPLRRWGPVAGLTCVLSLVYARMFAGDILYFRDLSRYIYPARWFVRRSLLEGDWPTWNPDVGLGFSVLANPLYGLFYPPHLALLAGPLSQGITWFCFAHMVFGGAGVIVLARRLGVGPVAALVGGAAWSMAGFTTSEWTAGTRLSAEAWIPWLAVAFLSVRSRASRLGARSWLGAAGMGGAVVALALLPGEPFVLLMGLAFAVVVAAAAPRGEGEVNDRRALGRVAAALALAVLLGMGVAAVTLVPASRVSGSTARAEPMDRRIAERFSLHPLRLVELAAPGAMGDPYGHYPAEKRVGEPFFQDRPLMFSMYAGGSILALALIAAGRSRRMAAALAGLAALSLLAALGRHTPFHELLRTLVLPLRYMRHPEKYAVIAVGCIAVAAALGAERLFSSDRQPWRRTAALVGSCLLLAGLAGLFPDGLEPFVRRGALHGAAGAAGVLAAQFLAARRSRSMASPSAPAPSGLGLAAVVLVATVTTDLAAATWPLQRFAPAGLQTLVPPAAQWVREDSGGRAATVRPRIYRSGKVDDTLSRFAGADSPDAAELRFLATLIDNTVTTFGIATVPGYDAAIPTALFDLWSQGAGMGQAVLRLLSVAYLILPVENPFDPVEPRTGLDRLMDPLPGARLYRVRDVLPRVYLAGTAEVASDREALATILGPDVVAGDRVLLAPTGSPSALPPGPPGRAGVCQVEAFANARIDATCDAIRPAVAVFVEQYDAGWSATVDGQPVPLWRANLIARAVPVPAGRHRIVLNYRPPGLTAGAVISAISLLALLACVFMGRQPRVPG